MSKRRNATTKETLTWIDRGDGQGEGKNYRPFLHVRDVPSQGRSRIVLGLKTGRLHHYLSDIEFNYHLLCEYQKEVIDIREQYALLPWDEPQKIAEQIQVRYPKYPVTQTPIIMTSDIMVTLKCNGVIQYLVLCIKSSNAIATKAKGLKRTLEKIEIEKIFWQNQGIDFLLVTENDLPKTLVANLKFIYSGVIAPEYNKLNCYINDFSDVFLQNWSRNKSLKEILYSISPTTEFDINQSFSLFSKSVWNKKIPIDINNCLIAHNYPILLI